MRVRSSVLVLLVVLLSVVPSQAAPRSASDPSPVSQIVKRLRNLIPKSLGDLLSPPVPRQMNCGKKCG